MVFYGGLGLLRKWLRKDFFFFFGTGFFGREVEKNLRGGKKTTKKSTRLVRHSLLVILDINFCARRMREYIQRG